MLVGLEVDYQAEDTYLFGFSGDLSAAGIFVRSHVPYAVGTRLRLYFRAGDDRVEVDGIVVWINAPSGRQPARAGMGIRFSNLASADRDRIAGLVRRFAELPAHRA